jgi:hypothetical protein
MSDAITYVGLDVHKETIAVALADGGGRGDVRAFGQIVNTPASLSRLLTKLVQAGREAYALVVPAISRTLRR